MKNIKIFSKWSVFLLLVFGYFQLVNCGSGIDNTNDEVSRSDEETTEEITLYTSFIDSDNWEAFDLQNSDVSSNDLSGLHCGVFDDRYVYFCGNKNSSNTRYGEIARYDTEGDFDSEDSWTSYDPGSNGVGSSPAQYFSGEYDGERYIYFIPYCNGSCASTGDIVRYDTQADFDDSDSWDAFDLSGINASYINNKYSTYDGERYLYIYGYSQYFFKYDTQADFDDAASWEVFDSDDDFGLGYTSSGYDSSAQIESFCDSIYYEGYLYFTPCFGERALRLDTSSDFTDLTSWEIFDLVSGGVLDDHETDLGTDSHPAGSFQNLSFDGQYIYFGQSYMGPMVRYNTEGDFDSADSWETADFISLGVSSFIMEGTSNAANNKSGGYIYGGFDGRYIYFLPEEYCYYTDRLGVDGGVKISLDEAGDPLCKIYHTEVLRFDSQGDFDSADSWETYNFFFNGTGTYQGASFRAGVFDGQYLYLVPYRKVDRVAQGEIIRFKARETSEIPESILGGGAF